MAKRHDRRLLRRQAAGMIGGKFAFERLFVDIGRIDPVRQDADLGQQLEAAGGCGSEDKGHALRPAGII